MSGWEDLRRTFSDVEFTVSHAIRIQCWLHAAHPITATPASAQSYPHPGASSFPTHGRFPAAHCENRTPDPEGAQSTAEAPEGKGRPRTTTERPLGLPEPVHPGQEAGHPVARPESSVASEAPQQRGALPFPRRQQRGHQHHQRQHRPLLGAVLAEQHGQLSGAAALKVFFGQRSLPRVGRSRGRRKGAGARERPRGRGPGRPRSSAAAEVPRAAWRSRGDRRQSTRMGVDCLVEGSDLSPWRAEGARERGALTAT